MDSLLGICLTTIEEASAYLGRNYPSEDTPRVVAAVNFAAAMLESMTGRQLAFRTYRTGVSATGSVVNTPPADPFRIQLASGSTGVKAGDPVASPGTSGHLRAGTVVAAVLEQAYPPGDVITLSVPTLDTFAAVALYFGSVPDLIDGPGLEWGSYKKVALYASEYPVVQVFAMNELQSDGTKAPLDITGLRANEVGLLVLPKAAPVKGDVNLEIHYSAGLRLPSATYAGDADAVLAQLATHRLAQISFQDVKNAVGRRTDVAVGQMSFRAPNFKIPDDVMAIVESLRRVP